MALFRKKTDNDKQVTEPESKDKGEGFDPQPEKARKWFEHARTSADSFNYGYALTCYANGIKLDPSSMSAHEQMYDAALRYMQNGLKPATSKEVRNIEDSSAVGRFAAAEFEWMKDLKNAKSALKALDAAIKADQHEYGNWVASRIFNLLRGQPKLGKGAMLQAMELFREVGAWDEALEMGEQARNLDPSDNNLAAELKNLAAQRAMDQGGYDQAGEGGFRSSIRDAGKQQELMEQDAMAVGESAEERNLHRAKEMYEREPKSADAINRYAQLLKRRSTPEAADQAYQLYLQGFKDTGEYRFRMNAGDIRIEQGEQRVQQLEKKVEVDDDPGLGEQLATARKDLLELKVEEYRERVKRYPTDRFRKYDLGTVDYGLGNYEEAMAQFQSAKDEPKLRARAAHMLGRCFFAEKWYSEAVAEFEEALQTVEATEKEREMMIRYDLMLALLESAREEQDVDLARQAKSICSDIARKDITYRDIRAKRKEVDDVIRQLAGE